MRLEVVPVVAGDWQRAKKSAEPLTVLKAESPGFAGESLGPAKLIEIDFPVPANVGNAAATQIAATAVIFFMLMFIFSFIEQTHGGWPQDTP